jgi:hypothetical protein
MLLEKGKKTKNKTLVRSYSAFKRDWKNGKVGSLTDHTATTEGGSAVDLGHPLSKGMFYEMWNTRMPHVKVLFPAKHPEH